MKIYNIKFKKGFSLLELLISITIMGLLATIVLNSVSTSRSKAYDSKIRQQLNSFRTAADIYFSNQEPNSYNTTGSPITVCSQGIFNDLSPTNGQPGKYIDVANLPTGTQVVCGAIDNDYAVKATLYSGNSYWCIDSKGSNREIQGPIGLPVTFCP